VSASVERVLIYRLGSLGDTVVALPCFHQIERAFPNAERRLLTNIPIHAKAPAAAAVLGDSGLVHGYLQYPVGMRSLRPILGLRSGIRRFRPQVLVYLASLRERRAVRRDEIFFRLCGISTMVGLPRDDGDFVRRELHGTTDLEPEAERLARAIRVLGVVDLDDRANWDLRLTAGEAAEAESVMRRLGGGPFLTVSVGTKAQSKDWGEENWTALLTRLEELYPAHRMVLMGAADEFGVSERSSVSWRGRSLNLCGNLNPRASAALLRSTDLFIGHDSGPMHLAATVGAPSVAIFAARHRPRIWFPYGPRHRTIYHRVDCEGCGLEICIEQRKKCILSITVEEVLAAIQDQLRGGTRPPYNWEDDARIES
jgi:heptosyltransferase-3